MLIRLQKYLADASIASRRKSEQIILDGHICVNGKVVTELGTKVDTERDIVTYKGNEVKINNNYIYIMFHKPEGCVTTVHDQFERKTVMDYIQDIEERIYPVGRLDFDTSGLLILTNDGDLTYRLTHPKHNIEKVYIANVIGEPTKEEINKFEKGLYIDNYKTSQAKLYIVKRNGNLTSIKVVIREGRNRQVRKMCEAINHPVRNLKRIATGKLFLGELKRGEYRHLTKEEVNYLKNL